MTTRLHLTRSDRASWRGVCKYGRYLFTAKMSNLSRGRARPAAQRRRAAAQRRAASRVRPPQRRRREQRERRERRKQRRERRRERRRRACELCRPQQCQDSARPVGRATDRHRHAVRPVVAHGTRSIETRVCKAASGGQEDARRLSLCREGCSARAAPLLTRAAYPHHATPSPRRHRATCLPPAPSPPRPRRAEACSR